MHGGKTILLVEDNPDDVELALRAFRKIDLSAAVTVARDGADALDYLCSATALPCLILLDLQLPKVSGLEVLRQLRADKRTRRVPIVMLTSSNEENDIHTSYELGANSFIRKPVDFTQFVETAKLVKTYWLTVNEPPPH